MLKYRLIFGTLMTIAFIAIVLFDPWKPILFLVLFVSLIVLGLLELSKIASAKGIKILLPISMPATLLCATRPIWEEFADEWYYDKFVVILLFALPLMLCFLYQRIRYGVSGSIVNIGGACFSMMYLGFLAMFITELPVEFTLWHLLMFVFVVKSCDIGAYTTGRLFGKHKFSPVISPKKTWEGMAGGVVLAVVVAMAFSVFRGIMSWPLAIVFGVCFAFLGQLGDLAESMLKRDAETKDASNIVPGFGGILDIVDSILIAAPFGYLFFSFFGR
jgi:phosphatidate cytidylyltransferase